MGVCATERRERSLELLRELSLYGSLNSRSRRHRRDIEREGPIALNLGGHVEIIQNRASAVNELVGGAIEKYVNPQDEVARGDVGWVRT